MTKQQRIFISVSIVVLYLIIPQVLLKESSLTFIGYFFLLMFMMISNRPGWSILILVVTLMFPYNGDIDESDKLFLSSKMWLPFNIIRSSILIIFVYHFIKLKRKIISKKLLNVYLVFLVASIFYGYFNNNNIEVISTISMFIYTYITFYIVYVDNISIKDFFYYMNIIFYLTIAYVVVEFIFHSSPYDLFYENYLFSDATRAKGLMGHPLLLSAFLSFYQVVLYAELVIFKKLRYTNFLLLIIVDLMTASRTTLILLIVAFLVYSYFEFKNDNLNLKKFLTINFSIFIIATIVTIFFSEYLDNMLFRFSDANADQRIGAYDVVWQIFLNNPLGVGVTGLEQELSSKDYSFSNSFNKELVLIDNMYLSSVSQYGIIAILYIYLYIFPLLNYRKYRKDKNYDVLTILYVVWFLQNFSFDSNYYISINIFFFTFVAILLKDIDLRYSNTRLTNTKEVQLA